MNNIKEVLDTICQEELTKMRKCAAEHDYISAQSYEFYYLKVRELKIELARFNNASLSKRSRLLHKAKREKIKNDQEAEK